jgi:type IX secretion system PorP/SprF family membrane protein
MKKLITKISLAFVGLTGAAFAQQDPQFTQFMFNKLIYNPGYAGTSNAICGTVQFRQQWASFDGAPTSIAAAFDMRIPNLPLGIGLNVISDKIGPDQTLFLRVPVAYNLQFAGGASLGIGVDAGIVQKRISADWIVPEPGKVDATIPGTYGSSLSNPDLNKLTYDVGAGIMLNKPDKYYIGLSSTHLPAQVLKGDGSVKFDMARHLYGMAGYKLPVTRRFGIMPNVKFKSDLAASALDGNLLFTYDLDNWGVWIGPSYRLQAAAGALIGGKFTTATGYTFRLGYSYDYTTSSLRTYAGATHEIVLGFCKANKEKKFSGGGNDRFLD